MQAAIPPAAPAPCQYCGWQPAESRVPSGPNHFRQLLAEKESNPEELLDQLPEELREILAGRLRPPAAAAQGELREGTVHALPGMGFKLTEDSQGARIRSASRLGSPPAALSPSDVVKLAAEMESGLKPRGQLPVCPKCQGLSPIGQSKCQWCGGPLPPTSAP